MKATKSLAAAIMLVCCCPQLPAADVESLSREIKALEEQLSSLRAELSTTQAVLRDVSKIVMTERLQLTVHISGNNRWTLEGKGLNGRDLGGKDLDSDQFVKVLKSITEEYPKPKISVANRDTYSVQDRDKLAQLVNQAGIYSLSFKPVGNP